MAPAVQPHADEQIHADGDGRHGDHQPSMHRLGMPHSTDRLPKDQQRDDHQRQRIDERGENTDAMIAVGHSLIRRLLGDPQRVPRKAQGRGIREVVPSVGEQGQAVREVSGYSFADDKR